VLPEGISGSTESGETGQISGLLLLSGELEASPNKPNLAKRAIFPKEKDFPGKEFLGGKIAFAQE